MMDETLEPYTEEEMHRLRYDMYARAFDGSLIKDDKFRRLIVTIDALRDRVKQLEKLLKSF